MEEMDYPEEVGERIATVNHAYPDFSITMTAYLWKPKVEVFKRKEHVDSKWCGKEELKSLDWAATDVDIVKSLQDCTCL